MKHRKISLTLFALTFGIALPTTSFAQVGPRVPSACANALQGRIAWDYQNNTTWSPANIERLCAGSGDDQPAQCFQRVLHGGIDFGGGVRWEWENAINLCQGTRNAAITVACFQGVVGTGRPWREAISTCGAAHGRPLPPGVQQGVSVGVAVAVPVPPPVAPPADPMMQCRTALEGRVAWDYQNSTTWSPTNIERLCRNGTGDQPAQCFQRVMHGGIDFVGGARWEWQNAINLCQETRNAAVTVACFQGAVSTGRPWREAIETCSRARGTPIAPPAVQPGVPVQQMQPVAQPVVPPPVVGFFRQSDQPSVYFWYAPNLYCHVQNEDQMAAYGGFSQVRVVPRLATGQQTGDCGWTNGFFRRSNEPSVFRLSGSVPSRFNLGENICHVVNEAQMAAYGGFAQVRVVNPTSDLGRGRGAVTECSNP